MPTINSNQLLESLHAETLSFLDEVIQKWQMMPDEEFSFQPSKTQWSAKQCFAHLNSYGDYYLPAINNAIANAKEKAIKPPATFTSGWLGNYFTKMMQVQPDGRHPKK